MIRDYLGKGNIARISLKQLKLPREHGGLRLVDLFKRQNAIKIQWVIAIQEGPFWQQIAHMYLGGDTARLIRQCNLHIDDIDNVMQTPSFWKQILYAWCLYNYKEPCTAEQIQGQIIWNNSFIKINKQIICNMRAWNGGLKYILDLLGDIGLFLTYDQLRNKFGEVLTWYEHVQIVSAILHAWKEKLIHFLHFDPVYYDNINRLSQTGKVSSVVYSLIIKDETMLDYKKNVWERRLMISLSSKEFLTLFKNIIKPTISTKLRDFQYRLLHNVIVTNHNLYTLEIKRQ